MADMTPEERRDTKRFDAALQTRQFEIDLFWKRSLFFWGFIGAAFVAIGALKNEMPGVSLLISAFGIVCSLAWTLVNRGSKYWQEQWETKIEEVETRVTGALFKPREREQLNKGPWLRGRAYSVSKLATAISDFALIVWIAIFVQRALFEFGITDWTKYRCILTWSAILFTFGYSIAVLWFGKSSSDESRSSKPPTAGAKT
jgi:hypothetical protein